MIPQEYIQEVVRRNDIEEVIGQYVQLRRRERARADMESAPTILFSTKGRKLHCIYYFLFIIYYFEKRRCSLTHDPPGIHTGGRPPQRH